MTKKGRFKFCQETCCARFNSLLISMLGGTLDVKELWQYKTDVQGLVLYNFMDPKLKNFLSKLAYSSIIFV